MENSIPWNLDLFHLLNASLAPGQGMLLFLDIVAQDTPYIVLAMLGLVWFVAGNEVRRSLMAGGVSLAIGLAVNFAIAAVIYVPRPFEAGFGHTFLAHAPETSFPSDHATFLWSLGLGLLVTRRLRWLGFIVSLVGAATAWARVYLGVHFPLDMLASLLISLAAAATTHSSHRWLDDHLFRRVERIYAKLITIDWPGRKK